MRLVDTWCWWENSRIRTLRWSLIMHQMINRVHLLQVVAIHMRGTLLLCGNSNVALQLSFDHSLGVNPASAIAKTLKRALMSYDLVDSWHKLHPTTKDFTFYSAPHNIFNRTRGRRI